MKKSITCFFSVLAFTLILSATALAQINVTFQVDMRVQILKGQFNPSTDIVTVRGSFNTWGTAPEDTMTYSGSDSVYTKTISMPGSQTIQYKFWTNSAYWTSSNSGYELPGGNNNRSYALGSSDTTIPLAYFDSIFTNITVNVTFRCNMRAEILRSYFHVGDVLTVRGTFNDWGNSTNNPDTLKDLSTDSTYSKTVAVPENVMEQYKYWSSDAYYSASNGYETISNRSVSIGSSATVLPVDYFNDDSAAGSQIETNIVWGVDMTTMELVGVFDPVLDGDSMRVLGAFNGWSSVDSTPCRMTRSPGPETYSLVTTYNGNVNDTVPYKYFMNFGATSIAARYPNYNVNPSAYEYEHPMDLGDGNRTITIQAGDTNKAPVVYFDGLHPDGIIPLHDTVSVTFQVDMRPAITVSDPFNPSQDTLLLMLQDDPWLAKQGYAAENTGVVLTDPDGDTVYTVSINVVGPATYGVLYRFRYAHPGGGGEIEGGGGGAFDSYRSRFIRPLNAQTFPRNYKFPLDIWQLGTPMPVETPPFSILSGSPGIVTGTPSAGATSSQAVLNGFVNPHLNNGNAYFQWGTSSAYGDTTSSISFSSASPSVPIAMTADVTGLVPGTTYHYRAVAQVGNQSYAGLDQTFQVVNNKWNILSLPYNVPDNTVATLFSGAVSPAYLYNGGYQSQTSMKPGTGYWLKFSQSQVVSMSGSPVSTLDIPVQPGWNLIGTISDNVNTANIGSVPSSIIASQFFGYGSSYTISSTLNPGDGYWVKTSGSGRLVMTAGSSAVPKGAAQNMNKLSAIIITDAAGNRQTLYFGKSADFSIPVSAFEMPPVPPAGIFDARFASGRMAEQVGTEKIGAYPIVLSSAEYPLTVSWNVLAQNGSASLSIGGTSVAMHGKGFTKVASNSAMVLNCSAASTLPTKYSLSQNYPNPFNPTTIIQYALPEDGHVKLSLYNVLGQLVATLVDENENAGYKSVQFDASAYSSGVYFYHISAGSFTAAHKMLLMK
jgi:hypothetical protein